MNEIIIDCNMESPQKKDSKINVSILNEPDEKLLYKFIVGLEGKWETLRDFGEEKNVLWTPKEYGNYILMVQAKREDSNKAFDYVSRKQFTIGEFNQKIISDVYLDKDKVKVGEKVTVTVESKKSPIMFRYLIKEDEKWILAKDYCTENIFIFSATSPGKQEVLVQCKFFDSEEAFEDAAKAELEVEDIEKLEIINFKCLNSLILVDEELVFEVDAKCEDNRTTLYKFIKLSDDGQTKCIQDYSTKKIVSYNEVQSGGYKLLCLAKDMYSQKEYDDRAILYYEVKPYKPIEIESFISELTSPQVVNQSINLKAIVSGGRELRYRFIIDMDGDKKEDSGYIRANSFTWEPKEPGNYKIKLWVKDVSCKEEYEACNEMEFKIDEILRDPVVINEVISNKHGNILIGEDINIKVIAEGGVKLLYSFIARKDGVEIEETAYEEKSYYSCIPQEEGKYEFEIRVKDKYSEKEFDAYSVVSLKVLEYIPAKIDYILMEPKEYYLVHDQIVIDVITRDTSHTLLKYVLHINGHKVEETDYVKSKRYILTPKCSGKYCIKVYAKNEQSKKEFDSIKEINLAVNDAPPIMNTVLKCDKIEFFCNDPITVTAESFGGKDVVYEFYLMERDEWNLVQNYSKKNYYTFIPFTKGKYKLLVLSKSNYKRNSYEDYCMIEIKVKEKWIGSDEDILMNIKLTEEEIKVLNYKK